MRRITADTASAFSPLDKPPLRPFLHSPEAETQSNLPVSSHRPARLLCLLARTKAKALRCYRTVRELLFDLTKLHGLFANRKVPLFFCLTMFHKTLRDAESLNAGDTALPYPIMFLAP